MKIEELEDQNSKLEEEKRNERAKYEEMVKSNSLIKDELNSAFEKITTLQNQIFDYEKNMQESNQIKAEVTILKTKIKENEDKHSQEIQNEKDNAEAEKQSIKKKYESDIEQLNLLNQQKSDEYNTLKSDYDDINTKLDEKVKEIEKLKKEFKEELEKQKQIHLTISTNTVATNKQASSLNTLTEEQSNLTQLITPLPSNRPSNTPISLSALLNPNDQLSSYPTASSQNEISASIDKQDNISVAREAELKKQVQNLMDLLNESERNVKELTKKENDLKEELDKMNRDEKRTTVNMEYLKNVVLSFLESNEKGKLVPVYNKLITT